MSADGAMVPLVRGEWAEVKTLVIGNVGAIAREEEREHERGLEALSYCSRLADVTGFERATLLETHRRGLEQAEQVAAVTDGADWLQGFIDYHRADAVRILDFAHAAEYLAAIGDAMRAAGHFLPLRWLEGILHRLKHEGPERVLAHLSRIAQRCADPEVRKKLQYLFIRRSQMLYPSYQAAGWPIGSGVVESANKLVVEARLKGAGMHWKRENVNPMLILRNAVCNDRWGETWQGSMKQEQQGRKQKREQQRSTRRHQMLTQLLSLLLPMVLAKSSVHEPPLPPESLHASVTPPERRGRTEAQKRWGRRPISLRGMHLQVEFAKQEPRAGYH